MVLAHCTLDERIAVLDLWARPLGLAVVPQDLTATERWQVRQAIARLRFLGDELENLCDGMPVRRVA